MLKNFCDNCRKEITKTNPNIIADRLEFRVKKFKFQVILATEGVWNEGCLCLECGRKLIPQALAER